MLHQIGTYRRFGAFAVLLIFLTGWSMGTLHRLLIHHEHRVAQECSVSHDPNTSHIHDETYANDHCSLCAFVLSTPELISISAILAPPVTNPDAQDSFHCSPACTGTIHDTTCLRGPPVL